MFPVPYYYPAQPMEDVYMESVFRENVCTDEWEVPGLMEDVYIEEEYMDERIPSYVDGYMNAWQYYTPMEARVEPVWVM
jgi:hypothetical protein